MAMGLSHSGEFSDAALYTSMERSLVSDANLAKYRIRKYWRYRDDILMLANLHAACEQQPSDFFQALSASTFYKLKFEGTSSAQKVHIQFLDLCISKCGPHFIVSHFLKESAMFCPLSPSSAHPPSTHRSWPKAYVEHVSSLCSGPSQKDKAILALTDRVAENYGDPTIIARMTAPRVARCPRQLTNNFWCPLEYHPVIFSRVQRALSELESDPSFALVRGCFGHDRHIAIRAAWRNAPVSLMQLLSNFRFAS